MHIEKSQIHWIEKKSSPVTCFAVAPEKQFIIQSESFAAGTKIHMQYDEIFPIKTTDTQTLTDAKTLCYGKKPLPIWSCICAHIESSGYMRRGQNLKVTRRWTVKSILFARCSIRLSWFQVFTLNLTLSKKNKPAISAHYFDSAGNIPPPKKRFFRRL